MSAFEAKTIVAASLAPFRNREAAFTLAVFLARFWSVPGRVSGSFPIDRRALADRPDLGLTEKRVRNAIRTLEAVGFSVKPYQTTVPSFGVWGYALAKLQPFETPQKLSTGIDLKFLNDNSFASMFDFPTDLSLPDEKIEINRLDNQALVRYYETEWRRFE